MSARDDLGLVRGGLLGEERGSRVGDRRRRERFRRGGGVLLKTRGGGGGGVDERVDDV